jgi:hypothetical protein
VEKDERLNELLGRTRNIITLGAVVKGHLLGFTALAALGMVTLLSSSNAFSEQMYVFIYLYNIFSIPEDIFIALQSSSHPCEGGKYVKITCIVWTTRPIAFQSNPIDIEPKSSQRKWCIGSIEQ